MYVKVVELFWKIHINYVLKNFFFTKGYYHEFNKKVLDHSKEINSSILIQLTIASHKIIHMFDFRYLLKYFRYLEAETSLNNFRNLGLSTSQKSWCKHNIIWLSQICWNSTLTWVLLHQKIQNKIWPWRLFRFPGCLANCQKMRFVGIRNNIWFFNRFNRIHYTYFRRRHNVMLNDFPELKGTY